MRLKKTIYRLLAAFLAFAFGLGTGRSLVFAEGMEDTITSKAAVLMEAETGTVILEKNADEVLRPASITKIMTLLLIFDALKAGKIQLDQEVTTSEYAASMGGSQVFLEPGEVQTVETLIKCIAVASANDACVAMAECISGSETEFVAQMNQRAKGLGMNNTHFVNCNGLDTEEHYSSARDVALMSRELITHYPEIFNYSSIWMENITHKTAKGESAFGLANTNKLIRQYAYATGLKTGSTSLAKYCVSATAEKDGVQLIAVIMAAPDYKARFSEASALLDYGFSVCRMYHDTDPETPAPVQVEKGVAEECPVALANEFTYLDMEGLDFSKIEKQLVMNETHKAPIEAGTIAGNLIYSVDGKEIGRVPVLYGDSVRKATLLDCIRKSFVSGFSI